MEWKLVPVELTAENGMKAALMGEFQVSITEWDEYGNEYIRKVDVPWHTIKHIHRTIVAAAPTPPAQEDELRKSAEDIIFHFDLFCRESACFGSVERIEKLRAALERK